ncbi:MAG: aldehyde dehydrogenase family protein [Caulobacteraceae bacterium]
MIRGLEKLGVGMPIPFGGDKLTFVRPELAAEFEKGDRLIVSQESGDLLRVPGAVARLVEAAVGEAEAAFTALALIDDRVIGDFFDRFAGLLGREDVWAAIGEANALDLRSAAARGRSTTRLAAGEAMRAEMIAGLRAWRDAPASRGRTIERIEHEGWSLEQETAGLGVVGFVFEGRPNVVADAAGVVRGGNAAVLRIGGDALATAQAIFAHALRPALAAASLPAGTISLIDSREHAAGWALFADRRLSLAVARGSGPAVEQLGAIARQSGTPVSLHGTGGAWLIADLSADAARFSAAVRNSLDRKVCNTLNVCLIVRERAGEFVPLFLEALDQAGRGHGVKLHVAAGDESWLPENWRTGRVTARRADGDHDEARTEVLPRNTLGREWEWEETPEVSLAIVADLSEAIGLFNTNSPRLAASLIAEDGAAQQRFFAAIDAPFVGDGFTRWVDGQYAFGRPELGLSNWRAGRLFARGGILTGDGVFTVRTRMRQEKPGLTR